MCIISHSDMCEVVFGAPGSPFSWADPRATSSAALSHASVTHVLFP